MHIRMTGLDFSRNGGTLIAPILLSTTDIFLTTSQQSRVHSYHEAATLAGLLVKLRI